jgi:cardiolipin hydrolase
MFFPNKNNEKKVASVLRKARVSIDVCVFAFTNDIFRDALIFAFKRYSHIIIITFNRGVKVRVISDDACSKFMGADIFHLGQLGIPVTVDSNLKVHMHNKFAIIDDLILLTGSFNWTSQAVN